MGTEILILRNSQTLRQSLCVKLNNPLMETETKIPPLRSSMHALLSVKKNYPLLGTETNAFDGRITRLLLMSVKK